MLFRCVFVVLVVSEMLLVSLGTANDAHMQHAHVRNLQTAPIVNHTSGFWRSDFIDSSARGAFFVQGEVLAIGECYSPLRAAVPVAIPTTAPSNAPSGVTVTANPTTETAGFTRTPSALPSGTGATPNPTVEPTAEPSANPTTETAGLTNVPSATASEQPSEEPTAGPSCGCKPQGGANSLLAMDADCASASAAEMSTVQYSASAITTLATEPFRKLVAVSEENNGTTATLYYADYSDSGCTTQVATTQAVQQTQDTVLTNNSVPLKVIRRFVTTFPPTLPGRYTVGYIIRYFGSDDTCGGSPYKYFVGTDRCSNYVEYFGRVRCNPRGEKLLFYDYPFNANGTCAGSGTNFKRQSFNCSNQGGDLELNYQTVACLPV